MSVSRETVAPSPSQITHGVSRETTERLQTFATLVRAWTAKINLVAHGDARDLWRRHIEDSLQLLPLIPASTDRIIDLGSGAGFPGLVLSIASDLPVDLVEADLRKAAFLQEAVRATQANASVCARRIENCGLSPARLVTARALAPLHKLLALAQPLLMPDGICLFLKGRRVADELAEARPLWDMHVEQHQSCLDPDARILKITELQRV